MKSSTKGSRLCPCGEPAISSHTVYYGDGNGNSLQLNLSGYCMGHSERINNNIRNKMIRRVHNEGYSFMKSIDPFSFMREEYERLRKMGDR